VGTGEQLNEHITGKRWPTPHQWLEMLEEAISAIRLLWRGGWQTHEGKYFTIDRPRIFTLPVSRPRSWSQRAGQAPPNWPGGWATA
jgi:alkanesulfonate monooxygenase SsuD/methylene tetrahydromethanopterin reductase-like flavin-dependent oxidoreductase (luciferase family)